MPDWIELYTPGDSALLVLARSYRDQALQARDVATTKAEEAQDHAADAAAARDTAIAQTVYTAPGAGAVQREVRDKLGEVVSPADYGALVQDTVPALGIGPGDGAHINNTAGMPFSLPIGAAALEESDRGPVRRLPVNPVLAPAAGASATTNITQMLVPLIFGGWGDFLTRTGEGFDSPGLETGAYQITPTTRGTWPLTATTIGDAVIVTGGTLLVFEDQRRQLLILDNGEIWTRTWSVVSHAPAWTSWVPSHRLWMDNGLGTISGAFDFNDFRSTGLFRRTAPGSAVNAPATTSGNFAGIFLCLFNHIGDFGVQVAWPTGNARIPWFRMYFSGAWQPWSSIASFEHCGALQNSLDSFFIPPGIWRTASVSTGGFPAGVPDKNGTLMHSVFLGGTQTQIWWWDGGGVFFRTAPSSAGPWAAWRCLTQGLILNGDARATTSAPDLNTFTLPAEYYVDSGATNVVNGPSGMTTFRGFVVVSSNSAGTTLRQAMHPIGSPATVHRRHRDAGAWGAWG